MAAAWYFSLPLLCAHLYIVIWCNMSFNKGGSYFELPWYFNTAPLLLCYFPWFSIPITANFQCISLTTMHITEICRIAMMMTLVMATRCFHFYLLATSPRALSHCKMHLFLLLGSTLYLTTPFSYYLINESFSFYYFKAFNIASPLYSSRVSLLPSALAYA